MARILIVEDDMANARIMERVLSRRGGHQVQLTTDAAQVLDLCRAGAVDLVLMDVALSNCVHLGRAIDGPGITRLLKADEPTGSIPVVLVTAHAMRGDRERLLAGSGAEGYVSKPIIDHGEFLQIVAASLQQSARRPRFVADHAGPPDHARRGLRDGPPKPAEGHQM